MSDQTTTPQIIDELSARVAGREKVSFQIPNGDAVDREAGLRWLRASIGEGYAVAYRLRRRRGTTAVWLKRWRPAENEPDWSTIIPQRRYPPLYERLIPIALALIVLIVLGLLVVIVAVALGVIPGAR